MELVSYAVATDEAGEILLHRADCAEVQRQITQGKRVMVMWNYERAPEEDYKRHSCLQN